MLLHEKSTGLQITVLRKILRELGFNTIKEFQKANGLLDDGFFGNLSYNRLYQIYLRPTEVNFNGFYFRNIHPKKQIVLHHSASADSAHNMYNWWRNDGVTHVATPIGITDSGEIVRGYEEIFWAHHIGMRNQYNLQRNLEAVAVEIMNWGYLSEANGKFYNYVGGEVPKDRVIELNYRGNKYYETYTEAEIESLRKWILVMAMRFNIPLTYSHEDMWNVSNNAIMGVPGIYSHNSYLSGKTDISPQPKMIEMLKSLESSLIS